MFGPHLVYQHDDYVMDLGRHTSSLIGYGRIVFRALLQISTVRRPGCFLVISVRRKQPHRRTRRHVVFLNPRHDKFTANEKSL
jgi:hypothetical protein